MNEAPDSTLISKTLDLLGRHASDCVTGYQGIVTSVSFDLYGCVQALVHAGLDEKGEPRIQQWFDVNRLVFVGADDRVMECPKFQIIASDLKTYDHGPAEKPVPGI